MFLVAVTRWGAVLEQELGALAQALGVVAYDARLVEALHSRAPAAHYDQRLLTQKRKPTLASVAGTARDRRVEESNERDNEIAAYLIALAQRQSQL